MELPTNYQKHTSENPIQKFLLQNFMNELLGFAKEANPKTVLDAGCGEGFTLDELYKNKIGEQLVGIDALVPAIELGKKERPYLDLKIGDIYNLSYKDNSFDLVICTEVLEHLEKPEKALEEIVRVSKKHLILSVPNEPFFIMANFLRGKYLKNFGNHPEHIQHWTYLGFKKFVGKKLKILSVKAPFAWTLVLAEKA